MRTRAQVRTLLEKGCVDLCRRLIGEALGVEHFQHRSALRRVEFPRRRWSRALGPWLKMAVRRLGYPGIPPSAPQAGLMPPRSGSPSAPEPSTEVLQIVRQVLFDSQNLGYFLNLDDLARLVELLTQTSVLALQALDLGCLTFVGTAGSGTFAAGAELALVDF